MTLQEKIRLLVTRIAETQHQEDWLTEELLTLFNKHTLEIVEGAKLKPIDNYTGTDMQDYQNGYNNSIDDYHTQLLNIIKGGK